MDKLQIKHFKAFKDEITIELQNKNLLLYGENGSGKSSLYEALKVIFFKEKVEEQIQKAPTPEEQTQFNKEFWDKYNNKISNNNFEIKINGADYKNFAVTNYQVFMIALESILLPHQNNEINLEGMLESTFLQIEDISKFSSKQHKNIENKVNEVLASFRENIKIEIDPEDDYKVKIIDEKRKVESKTEIKKYFNEAKINLITLLLLFTSISIVTHQSQDKKILVLDDFITSLDVSNRTLLAKYLFDNFSSFQILIFTHNVSFYNLLMYLANDIYKNGSEWEFANLYTIGGASKLYTKTSIKSLLKSIKEEHNAHKNNTSTQTIVSLGNLIRQRFEVLLYEYSKLVMIGAVEESDRILQRISSSKGMYFIKDKKKSVDNLIDEIVDILAQHKGGSQDKNSEVQILKNKLNSKINDYKQPDFKQFKQTIQELELYRKVTMHPMSHGTVGQHTFTAKEIESSLYFLEQLEKNIKDLVNKNVANM